MNILFFLLQAEGIVDNSAAVAALEQSADVAADAATKSNQPGSPWMTWVMLIALFVIMWLFMIRPQRKAQKEQEKFINAIQKGTKVVTAGGIYGTVDEVRENVLVITVDDGVKIRVAKSSVQRDPSATVVRKDK